LEKAEVTTMRKVLLALLALSACSDSKSTPPGDDDGSGSGSGSNIDDMARDADDVAASIGANLIGGDMIALVDTMNMAFGRSPDGFTVTQNPTYQLFTGMRGGLAVQYKLYCRDAANLAAPCNGLEFQAHLRPNYSGSVSGADASMDGIQRTAAWIVRNLTSAAPQIGGSGTDTFTSHLATGDYQFTITDTVDNVLFAPTPTTPVGGKLVMVINVARNRATSNPPDRSFTVNAVVTFTAPDTATITLDSTQNYELVLSTGAVTPL
jgi:hypothetical protein